MSRAKRRQQRGRARDRGRRLRVLGAIAAAALFGLGAFLFTRPSDEAVVPPLVAYAAPERGEPNAPITIVEYADFQCPSCGAFTRSTAPRLVEQYVRTGQAKIVFKHFAWIGEESRRAAEASACAHAQGRFWDYHDILYANQRGENSGAFSTATLKRLAGALGLDQAQFDSCVDGRSYRAAVAADFNEVRSMGLTGTPTFFVNGQRIVGAQPYAVFERAIQAKLEGR